MTRARITKRAIRLSVEEGGAKPRPGFAFISRPFTIAQIKAMIDACELTAWGTHPRKRRVLTEAVKKLKGLLSWIEG